MCFVNQLIDSQLEELRIRKEELVQEVTTYDRLMSKMYHELEGIELTKRISISISRKMQETLRERRRIKFDLIQVKTLINYLDNAKKKLLLNEQEYFKNVNNYKKYIS